MTTKVITKCKFELTMQEVDILKSAHGIVEQMSNAVFPFRNKDTENAKFYEACATYSEAISTIWSSDMVDAE